MTPGEEETLEPTVTPEEETPVPTVTPGEEDAQEPDVYKRQELCSGQGSFQIWKRLY